MLVLYFKMNKKLVIFAFVFFFTCSLFAQPRLKSFDTKIKIKTEKKVYFILEPIWISTLIKNKNKKGPDIPRYTAGENYYILNSKGERLKPVGNIDYFDIPPMSPNEIIEEKKDIVSVYGFKDGLLGNYLPSDTYSIKYVWRQSGFEPLFSNEIKIIVKEPSGIEKNAMELLKEGIRKHKEKDIEGADKEYYELVDIYPNSVYATKALMYIMLNHSYKKGIEHDEKRIQATKTLLEKYPNNKYINRCFRYIKDYYNKINDSEGLRDYLNKLAEITSDKKLKEKIIKELNNL